MTVFMLIALSGISANAQTQSSAPRDLQAHWSGMEAMDLLPPQSIPQPQLYDGLAGIIDAGGVQGFVVTEEFDSHFIENWFFNGPNTLAPSQGWSFSWVSDDLPALPLGDNDDAWIKMTCVYIDPPPLANTNALNYVGDQITNYSFELWGTVGEDWKVVGHMHREHHHHPQAPSEFADYWVFSSDYSGPTEGAPLVSVIPVAQAYTNGAQFFQVLSGSYVTTTKVQYDIDVVGNYL